MADASALTAAAPRAAASRGVARIAGVALALAAGVWHAVLMSTPTNDNFLHMALGQQLLAGDLPVRDFFDNGLTLQLALSALAEAIVGHRLLSEALIVGASFAVSVFLVFALVRRMTGSTAAAVLSSVLVIVSGPRGYSYPKVVVYAVAAALWWAYVRHPSGWRAAALGAWTAAAFYWRPDHGVYVAVGVVLAALAAHGVRPLALTRSVLAGAVTLVLTLPFFLFAHAVMGLGPYMETGFAQAGFQHEGGHDLPRWPLRGVSDLVRMEPAERVAPRIALRWTADSTPEARAALLARYGLEPEASEGPLLQHVRLSRDAIRRARELIAEPIVEDTAGIDRGSATLPRSSWTQWERWQFEQPWLRVRLLPGLDEHSRASEAAAMLFYAVPLAVLVLAVPLRRRFMPHLTAGALAAFAAFGAIVTLGLLRTPYDVRAVDGVVMPAILMGVCAGALLQAAASGGWIRRGAAMAAAAVFILLTTKSVAVAGQFGERVSWLAGDWRSLERTRGAWNEVYHRLTDSPPLPSSAAGSGGVSLRLAAYARQCLAPSDRLVVLWFAPEIYYYSGRLAAQRHLVIVPGWAALPHEQRMTLEKVRRFAPPLVFAAGLDGVTEATYPDLVGYVRREYEAAGSLSDQEDDYVILARRDRQQARAYGEEGWPCYV